MIKDEIECRYFGCWGEAGHYMHLPGGRSSGRDDRAIEYYGESRHIDGTLAPRKHRDGTVCCGLQDRDAHEHCPEMRQGLFLLHHLDNGWTAIQWWDRNQGDSRGACNSTVLAKGQHTADEMVALAERYFPQVMQRLSEGNFELVEVQRGPTTGAED
jgi:hypothetical protein